MANMNLPITATRIIPHHKPVTHPNPQSAGVFPVAVSWWDRYFFGPQGLQPMAALVIGVGATLFFIYVFPWVKKKFSGTSTKRDFPAKMARMRRARRRGRRLSVVPDSMDEKRDYVRRAIEEGEPIRARR